MRYRVTDASWHTHPPTPCSAEQKDWLTRDGSLTAHLRKLGQVDLWVSREEKGLSWADEYRALGLSRCLPVWVREVILMVDGKPYVYARSLTPVVASLTGWQAVRRIGNRPLADLLFRDHSVTRSALASRRVTARHPLHLRACHASAEYSLHALLARRSVFMRQGAPLLITECMLPGLWAQLERSSVQTGSASPVTACDMDETPIVYAQACYQSG
ncbi:chorismate--pyruvate lyase family protein [Dyella choica]|uniref:Probable chorismate pyruvate-lyase n=1 Tax=Dyella choica TaxID=1927959 RepID=A0A3S0S250_9GAMM|nr:chorismate lyase [Dyella choica]RUL78348.1 chorismate lyase [Dyella choica]